MPSVAERVANLEGKVSEQSNAFGELRGAVGRLEHRMDSLEDNMTHQFHWIVGIQITSLIATIAAVLGALLARA